MTAPITTEDLRKLLSGATPGPLKARRSTMDDEEWEVYPTREGRKPPIRGTQWAEIATVSSDNENCPGRAKGNALLFASAPTIAAELITARAKLEAAVGLAVQMENLLSVYREPDKQLCCDGRMCGCQGATVYQEAEYYASAALAAWEAAR